jgi:hypothetical protein
MFIMEDGALLAGLTLETRSATFTGLASAPATRSRGVALMFSTASSLVEPWLTQPRMDGHSAIQARA